MYRGPRYFTTINLRLSAAASPAPFWSLLNYGSKNVNMSSDIGGTPYPSRGGHHFVEKTENRIKSFFRTTLLEFKEQFLNDEALVNDALADSKALLERLQQAINNLAKNAEFMDKIAKEIGISSDQLDASKILIAYDRIKSGDIFTTQIVVGAGKRIRTKRFIELLSGYGE